ncbi:MAG: DNA-processing protein DprA [Muribaculaceae bacterium]|nr:DNA-processing protein DprA [Muribaculaceae bacterium]
MNEQQLTYRIAFASIRGMGIDIARSILDVIPSEQEFFSMKEGELMRIIGSRTKIHESAYRSACLEKAKRELDFIYNNHIRVAYFLDDDYPARLLQAPDAPILLYSIGECNLNASRIVSVVGTRHATDYGRRFCNTLMSDLAQVLPDVVIVSGLAFGIDIAAHRASLKYGLHTVGVQARGLNKIYPSQHRNDAAAIVKQGGAIVSDYTSQDDVHKGNFVARNRIIAALSDCTVVVESANKGGALITANIAASYNRDVLAVPGRITDEYSKGCNRLIMNNQAAVITSADDLLKAMNWQSVAPKQVELELFPKLSAEEQIIVDTIRNMGDAHINSITQQLGMPVYKVMSALVELECRGIVASLPGCRYTVV